MSAGRGPLQVGVTVPPPLVEVVDALAAISGRSLIEEVQALVTDALREARDEPLVQETLEAMGRRAGLYVVRPAP